MATEIDVKNAPRETAKVQKVQVTVPAPYKEGHKLRANEAEALNSYYVTCIRNSVAEEVKEKLQNDGAINSDGAVNPDAVDVKGVQKIVDDFVADYDFGQRTGGGGDPVEREAMEIARGAVRNAIRKKGASVSDYSAKAITEQAKKVLQSEKHGPAIRKKAEQIVQSRQEVEDIAI